ncbi:hypothetical protein M085_3913, partial [Bacteroides fragilis str. 3986 N(B)19]
LLFYGSVLFSLTFAETTNSKICMKQQLSMEPHKMDSS